MALERIEWPDTVAAVDAYLSGERNDPWHQIERYSAVPVGRTGGVAFDVGCGGGQGIVMLARKGYTTIVGVDKYDAAAEVCESFNNPHIRFEQSRIEEWHPDCRADVVCLCDVLEHVREPTELLRRAAQWLKPEGVLYVAGPLLPDDGNEFHLHKWDRVGFDRLVSQFCEVNEYPDKQNDDERYCAICTVCGEP